MKQSATVVRARVFIRELPFANAVSSWMGVEGPMNLLQLRYFTAVAEELSFRRAAERLHISQPPLSFHIKAMEHSLGTRLFDRTTRAVTLTDAGAVLLERAHRILRLVDDVSDEMQAIAAGAAGALRVGLTD